LGASVMNQINNAPACPIEETRITTNERITA
jgi:hypothetical protein